MHLAVIGCQIFRNEVNFVREKLVNKLNFFWLEQKLHSDPDKMRKLIQAKIDEIDEIDDKFDGIVLLYGLCSKGTIGIRSKIYRIIVPRVQDCIAILLGSNERYMKHFKEKPGTYWFSLQRVGWILGHFRGIQPLIKVYLHLTGKNMNNI